MAKWVIAAGIEHDETNGKFGLFNNQLFVSEQTHSKVLRVFLEKVNGFYQDCVFPFLEGFGSGNIVTVSLGWEYVYQWHQSWMGFTG